MLDRLEALFLAHEGQWLDGKRLSELAGYGGWRTRISELRTQRGYVIESRVTSTKGQDGTRYKHSAYRMLGKAV